jgi:hypothetical protein
MLYWPWTIDNCESNIVALTLGDDNCVNELMDLEQPNAVLVPSKIGLAKHGLAHEA